MIKFPLNAVALAVALFLVDPVVAAESIEIKYIPIGMHTYQAIDTAGIDNLYFQIGHLEKGSERYNQLMSLLDNPSEGSFNDWTVRVKISSPGSPDIFIDNDGGMRTAKGDYALSDEQIEALKAFLESTTEKR
jgi:hypothetical protein